MMRNLTIEDKRGSWFHPHLSVDQVRSACFLGAALTCHQLGYMGHLSGPRGKTQWLHREKEADANQCQQEIRHKLNWPIKPQCPLDAL